MASNSKITGPESSNTPPDANASYTEKVGSNVNTAIDGHLDTLNNLAEKQVAVFTNKNASTAQKATSVAIGVSETMMAAVGAVTGAATKLSEAVMMPIMEKLAAYKGTATLPVCKQMDPVLGIDIHMIMFPPVPAPVPIPHPYVGISFRAKDFVACLVASVMPTPDVAPTVDEDSTSDKIDASNEQRAKAVAHAAASMALSMLGATVKFGGYLPRTVAGTPTKNVISHFPIGPKFHPVFSRMVEKDHGHALLGSFFVVADGSPLTGSPVHLHNDCWDVGIFSIHNIKPNRNADGSKKKFKARLYVPSGVIMPIPWTRPVITNPVPAPINPLVAPLHIFKAAFAKLKRAAKKKIDENRKKNEERIKKSGLPCGAKTFLSKLLGTKESHPVDVAEGYFYTDNEDFSLPGPIPLHWERTWYSYSDYQGPMGYGWHHSYDMAIGFDHDAGTATIRMNDGRGVDIELPTDPAKPTYSRKEKLRLFLQKEEKYYFLKDSNELIYRFTDKGYSVKGTHTKQYLLQSISNTNAFAIRFAYDQKGFLEEITDSAGRKLSVENDAKGRIAAIYAPHPQLKDKTFAIASYKYSDEGDMITHMDPLDQPMLFEYKNHLMVKEVWRNGLNWQFVYNGNNSKAKCVEVWGDGDLLHYKFDYSNPKCTLVTNSLGHLKTYYHRHGLVTKYIDPNGVAWEYRYNNNNELEWTTDPLGHQSSWTHDDWGNIITSTDPCGGFNSREYYHPKFPLLPTEAMDSAGGKWKWEYDEHGNIVQSINPLGAKTKYNYEDGLLKKIINAADAVTTLQYDKEQNLIVIQTDDGATTEYLYDLLGNCTRITNPNGVKQKCEFDYKGRIEKVADFDGNIIYLEYDEIDNIIKYRDKQKEVEYTYRGLWKLTSRTEAGATIIFKYDTEEQLRKIVNEHNLPYRFTLDPAGNITEEIGFDDITRRYERNAAGSVTQVLRPAGKFTKYRYDACGRVTEVVYSDEKQESYTYRPDGALMQAVNESATVQFERNVMGDIVKETVNGEWIASEYDIFSNRIKTISSLGANITNQYNKMGDVLQMEANGWQAKFEHDKLGLETARFLPGGISSQWQRDGIGRPIVQTVGHTAGNAINTRRRKQYQWDVNDRLKQIVDDKGITRFEHDDWSNLAKTIFPNGEVQLRNPDATGNLFTTPDRKDRVYAKGGQLKKANSWEYSYDAEGNLIEKKQLAGDSWKYAWNDADMLTKVVKPDKTEVSFTYDALGRRLSKQYKNTITKFVWDGNVPLHEWKEHAQTKQILSNLQVNGNGKIDCITTWLFDTDSFAPCGKIKGDKQYGIVTDHLGTPVQMYKDDGSLFWDCELDSYGKVRMEKGEIGSCPFRYQGQYEDVETGLFYNRFRYYSIDEGLYLSKDPIGLNGGIRFYGYVKDTNLYIDQFGLNSYRAKLEAEYQSLVAEATRRHGGNVTVQRRGAADLFRVHQPTSGHGNNVTQTVHNTAPNGRVFLGQREVPVRQKHVNQLRRALNGDPDYNLRTRGGR